MQKHKEFLFYISCFIFISIIIYLYNIENSPFSNKIVYMEDYYNNGNMRGTQYYDKWEKKIHKKSFYENGVLESDSYVGRTENCALIECFGEDIDTICKNGCFKGKEMKYSKDGKLRDEFCSLNFVQHGWTKSYDTLGNVILLNYKYKGISHYIKQIKQNAEHPFIVDTLESYIPILKVNKESLLEGDTLTMQFELPLPKNIFDLHGMNIEFWFYPFDGTKRTFYDEDKMILSIEDGWTKELKYLIPKGSSKIYYQIFKEVNGTKWHYYKDEKLIVVN